MHQVVGEAVVPEDIAARVQIYCGNRCANSRSAAIPLLSARARQPQRCLTSSSVDALDRLHSSLSSCRIE